MVVVRGRGWSIEHVDDVREYAREHGYDLTSQDLDGICLDSEALILVDAALTGCHRLEIEIHELIHAYDPDIPEKRVRLLGLTLARALWRLGYRQRDAVAYSSQS